MPAPKPPRPPAKPPVRPAVTGRAGNTGGGGQKSHLPPAPGPSGRRAVISRPGQPDDFPWMKLLLYGGTGMVVAVALLLIGTLVYFNNRTPDTLERVDALIAEQSIRYLDRSGTFIGRRGPSRPEVQTLRLEAPQMLAAVLAIEDRDFYSHKGVRLSSLMSSAMHLLVGDHRRGGGATITMQLAKNVYGLDKSEEPFSRKIEEVFIAYKIEDHLSKDQILELYFQTASTDPQGSGIERGALTYFGKPLDKLSLAQAARLAGALKGPSEFDPSKKDSRHSHDRAELTLSEMRKWTRIGPDSTEECDHPSKDCFRITEQQYQQAKAENDSLQVEAPPPEPKFFVDWLDQQVRGQYADKGDLSVNTTLDSTQAALARAAVQSMPQRDSQQMALVSMDGGGAVLAMVGGKVYYQGGFNNATDGGRPAGSALKPFVYAAAFERGVKPNDVCDDIRFRLPNGYSPSDIEPPTNGPMTLDTALVESRNIVAIRLGEQIGYEAVRQLLHDTNLRFQLQMRDRAGAVRLTQDDFPSDPVAFIGGGKSADIRPIDLAAAYASLANGGLAVRPHGIVSVVGHNGERVDLPPSAEVRHVFDPRDPVQRQALGQLDAILRQVVVHGTATNANITAWPVAGKTGTTESNHDGWFAGFVPNAVAVAWIGPQHGSRHTPIVHSSEAATLFRRFMKPVLNAQTSPGEDYWNRLAEASEMDTGQGPAAYPNFPTQSPFGLSCRAQGSAQP